MGNTNEAQSQEDEAFSIPQVTTEMSNGKVREAYRRLWGFTKKLFPKFSKFPDWKHEGWQVTLFFGSLPDPHAPMMIILGWKTLIFGVFKKNATLEEGKEITSDKIKGFILQGQIWLPFDRFGKL